MPPRAGSIDVRRWLSLVAVIWLQSINGTNSNFPAYSSELKQMMSISQVQLNNLAFASDAGKVLGWLSGIAALYLPLWLVLVVGAFLGLLSYGLQYLLLSEKIPGASLPYAAGFLLTVLAGNSICWINTVCYAVIIGSFPSESRQVAVGLTASYQGLSPNIYTNIVDVVVPGPADRRAKAYLLLNSILPAIVSVVTAPITAGGMAGHTAMEDQAVPHDHNHRHNHHHHHHNISRPSYYDEGGAAGAFGALFTITIATGVYAVVSSFGIISTEISPVFNMIGIGLLLMAPLAIPLTKSIRWSRLGQWWAYRQHGRVGQIHDLATSRLEARNDNHHPERAESGLAIVKEEDGRVQRQRPAVDRFSAAEPNPEEVLELGDSDTCGIGAVREEVGVKLMLRRIDFWLYFFVYLFGATLGLVYLNNLGQITESRGSSGTSVLVSLASAFGFFGRLLPSLLDYFFSRQKYVVPRPACVVALMAPMTGSFFLLLNSSSLCLYISTAVIGICTGAITSIAVSITTELFGMKKFSVNHNVLVVNIPIGSFVFGYLAAVIYRREGNGDGKCIGMECYRSSFIIWGSLCFLGTNLALLLYARSRNFYSRGSTRG